MSDTGKTRAQLEAELERLHARVAELESHEAELTRAREELAREHSDRELERERLRTILDMLPVGVFIADASGHVLESNAAARAIWGERVALARTAPEHSAPRGWRVSSGAVMQAEDWPLVRAVMRGEACIAEEIEIETRDGSRRVLLDSAVSLRDEHGAISGAISVHVDITTLKRVEQDIRRLNGELEQRIAERTAQLEAAAGDAIAHERAVRAEVESARTFLSDLLDQTPAVICMLEGPDYICRYLNPFGLRLLAPAGIDPRGSKLKDALPGLREQGYMTLLDRVYHHGETIVRPETYYRFEAPSGESADTWWDVVFVPWRNPKGDVLGVIVLGPDVTERVRHQLEREQLEERKDELLNIASHELKTPLTSLKGRVQLALRQIASSGSTPSRDLLWMELAVARMERLVNDLVDAVRVGADTLTLRRERCDLVEICRAAAEDQSEVSNRPIALELPDEQVELDVDPDRVTQIVTNLLSNALKYSPASEPVTLGLRRKADEVVMLVRDAGPGIPSDALPRLFDRFYRVPGIEAQSGTGEGLGLGLYICRKIVGQHGGSIWCESEQGHGATFYVALPIGQ